VRSVRFPPRPCLSVQPLTTSLAVTDAFALEYLEYYRMLPLSLDDGVLSVAVAGAPHPDAIDDLARSYSARVEIVPVEAAELTKTLRSVFASAESMVELVHDLAEATEHLDVTGDSEGLADARDLANQPPVIRFVNLLIREAFEARASDIHLESVRDGLRVRFRLDGVLTDAPSPPASLRAAVVSRLKLIAELDIAERRVPQDGRVRIRLESGELDIRVSTVPTLHGESVVLRLLDRGGRPVALDELGMGPDMAQLFGRLVERPHGIVLATGPTGSGKTTTLYAALGLRHPTEEKIITVEDPVEYHLPGVTQVPVHARSGVTFATALRSLLRQDPDVLMVGEMRDAETAGIAVQAAMTGHLVFSTLHTNDAVTALTRLIDLKVEPYLVAATIEGVLAQRLVRRVCTECRQRYRPDSAAVAMLAARPVGDIRLERGRGCDQCRGTGYRGRTGIYELLRMSDELRQMLLGQPHLPALRQAAREQGMATLREDGWAKVQAGITTVEEVLRVVQA
jgi:type II secretory ATPase GspE/PulE/Tfp pilus assembly ATPase PilB-like protein